MPSNADILALAELVAKGSDIETFVGLGIEGYAAWSVGSATGGPNGDGCYPLPLVGGGEVLVPSPAKLYAAAVLVTSSPDVIILTCAADEAIIATGANQATMRTPFAFTINAVRSSVVNASLAGAVAVDIKANGVSIFMPGGLLRISVGHRSSVQSGADYTPPTLISQILPDDAEITVDIISGGTSATGLKVTLIGVKSA